MTRIRRLAASLAVPLLLGACGPTSIAPSPVGPSESPGSGIFIEPGRAIWRLATVVTLNEVSFPRAASEQGVIVSDRTTWVRVDGTSWLPAEPIVPEDRLGLIEWQGRVVSWADGGLIRTSPDGLSWQDAISGPGQSNPTAIVSFGNQLVLLGQGIKEDIGAWRSGDGSRWTAIKETPLGMQAAAEAADQGLIAVGVEGPDPAVWRTLDGEVWATAAAPRRKGEQTAALMGVAGDAKVVIGIGDRGGQATAWRSHDLATWTEAKGTFGPDAALVSVWNIGGVFAIAGSRNDRADIWLSTDGATWSSTDLPTGEGGGSYAAAVRVVDDDVVVFGYSTEDAGNGGSFRTGYLVWTLVPGG